MTTENRLVVEFMANKDMQVLSFKFSYDSFSMRKNRNSAPTPITTYLKILDELITLTRRPPKRKGTFDFKNVPYALPDWVPAMERYFTSMDVAASKVNGMNVIVLNMGVSVPMTIENKQDFFNNKILEFFSLIVGGHSFSFTVDMNTKGDYIFIQKASA